MSSLRMSFQNVMKHHDIIYAPNFEEVDGAYWFQVVRASVRSSRTMRDRILKFHIWIPHGEIADTRFFFLVLVISQSGVMLL